MAAAPKQQTLKKVRILLFGDSLTSGWCQYGAEEHPYQDMLVQMLAMAFPQITFEMVLDGRPGATVSKGYLDRLRGHFKKETRPFDWTIILGGTTDLAEFMNKIEPEELFGALKRTWDVALAHESKVMVMTIPEMGLCGPKSRLSATRDRVNELIKSHHQEGFFVFDLARTIPFFTMSERDRARYWDDDVHFTPVGYDFLGTKLGVVLVSQLEKQRIYNSPVRRKRVFKDDKLEFDEENGSELSIDQGYVVVRFKDLD